MRHNFDHKKGLENLFTMYKALGKEHVNVNSISASNSKHEKDKFVVAQIVELDQDNQLEDHSDEDNTEAGVHSIHTNKIPIGKACSPYEVIQVQTKNGLFRVVTSYDTGSENTLCNFETGPLVVDTKKRHTRR